MSDSFSAFKLHSYNPNRTIITPLSSAITSNPYCLCVHCANLLPFNVHHIGEGGEGITSSTRWSPTPAQLLYLEQLYTQGTKTPSAHQIQLIALQLRRFGNIQAKNVFYWFQNHKARDRQKRRRCDNMEISSSPPPSSSAHHHHKQLKDHFPETLMVQSTQHACGGLRGTSYEVKGTNKWASSSNCSALAEVSDSLNRADGREAHRSTKREERKTLHILRIKREERQSSNPTNRYIYDEEEEVTDDRTLKLFPLNRSDEDADEGTESSKHEFCSFNIASVNYDEISSNQFYEFLPLRK